MPPLTGHVPPLTGHVALWHAATIGLPPHAALQALLYDTTDGDEVEDLLALLVYAKQQMPDLQAVSCGAIASDYQRLRVEHVCSM